ncbi:Slp family lipoprotein [Geobacter sp. DSM 9736]|uniref:Slp family lipoprotein n=1 Tax=Geobacter sp. DSM 9736 TaxID=1277350 RepID=UPI000B4FE38F|nr:Slp family lipoprotein [Geobacter sp. DSM 9736]SNB46755.1 outer membrane lipoprotein [Geobacter sp. DSM 9736]
MRLFLIMLALLAAGCAHRGISKESVQLSDRTVTFPALRENPSGFVGKYVYLGGAIASVRNNPDGGEMEVVELPLSRSGRPKEGVQSEGRFLARTDKFLDPIIYKRGMAVSLVGEVTGEKTAKLEEVSYRYPVVMVREMHLWSPDEGGSQTPQFHFGLGIFKGF